MLIAWLGRCWAKLQTVPVAQKGGGLREGSPPFPLLLRRGVAAVRVAAQLDDRSALRPLLAAGERAVLATVATD
jgi:hypothetical protein